MSPKAKEKAAKAQSVSDKTFGLKNKKGAKQQKFVAQVKVQVAGGKNNAGPSKKDMKELQKQQEQEMMELFNAVPAKKMEQVSKEEDLDPDAGPTFTDITQEIEYQRANVVAKTKITDEVFQKWRSKKTAKRRKEESEKLADRKRRGMLTGREIFMESSSNIQDDDMAGDDEELQWEIDAEQEIATMEAFAKQQARLAREAVGLPPEEEEQAEVSGASTFAAVKSTPEVQLTAEEQAELFDDDSDDDDLDLDELENQVRNTL